MQLNHKQIVITGGSGALGTMLTHYLLDQGASVIIIDRHTPTTLPKHVTFIQGDLSNLQRIAAISEQLKKLDVDILINLAGLQYFGPCEHQTAEHSMLLYTVNLVAPVLLTQAILPHMKQRGTGHIVNIGSTFGSINFAHFATYSSSKAGLRGFSEALRREVRSDGIAVTYIAPRAVRTPLNTEKVMEFASITKMNMDEPEWVISQIVKAIVQRKKDVFLGFPEKLFVRINAITPRIVDQALASNDKKAKSLFTQKS